MKQRNPLIYFIPCLIPIIYGFCIPLWRNRNENAQIITTIIIGAVTIIAAIIVFTVCSKSENDVIRDEKPDLKPEHNDLKDILNYERQNVNSDLIPKILNSQNQIEDKINTIMKIINIEIAKSEERKKYLTPERVTLNQVAEQINNMHSNWLEANAKINLLEKERIALNKRIAELENENSGLKTSLEKAQSEYNAMMEKRIMHNNVIVETQNEDQENIEI